MDERMAALAALARLSLTEEEAARLGGQLDEILAYVERLGAVDTEGVEPTVFAGGAGRARPAGLRVELAPGEATAAAADAVDGAFRVPRVIG